MSGWEGGMHIFLVRYVRRGLGCCVPIGEITYFTLLTLPHLLGGFDGGLVWRILAKGGLTVCICRSGQVRSASLFCSSQKT